MSNHSGSYMLNEILIMLDKDYKFFEGKSKEEVNEVFSRFTKIGCRYDCNDGEILDDIGEKNI